MKALGDMIREALAHMAAGPPDNGVSHRRALAALESLEADLARLVAERAVLVEIAEAAAKQTLSSGGETLVELDEALAKWEKRKVRAKKTAENADGS